MRSPSTALSRQIYGTIMQGEVVESFTLKAGALTAKIITLWAPLAELHLSDEAGERPGVGL
jgi:hypothetical protein